MSRSAGCGICGSEEFSGSSATASEELFSSSAIILPLGFTPNFSALLWALLIV